MLLNSDKECQYATQKQTSVTQTQLSATQIGLENMETVEKILARLERLEASLIGNVVSEQSLTRNYNAIVVLAIAATASFALVQDGISNLRPSVSLGAKPRLRYKELERI